MRTIDADELKQDLLNKSFYPAIVAAAIKRAPTVNPYEWISIEDDKPKKNNYYLCWRMTSRCGDKETWQIDKLYWEDNLWLMHHNTFKVVDYVTYWTYLPTPPTEKEN